MATDALLSMPAVLLLLFAPLGVGALLLLRWLHEPIVEARRLALEPDPAQENTFEDLHATSSAMRFRPFGSLGDAQPSCSLSVVLPAYNEQDRILVTLEDTVAYLDERSASDPSFSYEIIVVDDCSTDRTVAVIETHIATLATPSNHIRLLRLATNHGKGGAVRKGVMRARGTWILFADADNATEIRDLAKLEAAAALTTNNSDSESKSESQSYSTDGVVVCGSRAHLETAAIATRHPLRNLLMHGFHLIVSTLCVQHVRDTQCGFKLFDRTAARVVFAPLHIERWAFDVELLYIAAARKLRIKEVAVQWHEVPGSKLSVVAATLTMLREIVLIRLCYSLGIWSLDDGGFRLAKKQQL